MEDRGKMIARSIKRIEVGDPPLSNSAEIFELNDGRYQVVLRLLPSQDDWEPGTCPPHQLEIRDYTNGVEANVWFKMLERLLRGTKAPG
jgi:hypothetical protein